jgi:hypothetical protein
MSFKKKNCLHLGQIKINKRTVEWVGRLFSAALIPLIAPEKPKLDEVAPGAGMLLSLGIYLAWPLATPW